MNAADRAELAAIRADVAEMRKHLAQFAKVAGIIYDSGWDDALGRRPARTARVGVTAPTPTSARHLRAATEPKQG